MKPIQTSGQTQLPNQVQINKMWKDFSFVIVDKSYDFIDLLANNLGGMVYFKGFKIKENDIFDWFCSRGRLNEIDFTNKFLLSKEVLKTFKHSNAEHFDLEAKKNDKEIKLDWKSEFVIDGELASLLYHGGAYGSEYNKTPKEIKIKAQELCNELFEEDYIPESVRFYTSDIAWNDWFYDFIIDLTFIIICMKSRTIWILAYTDID